MLDCRCLAFGMHGYMLPLDNLYFVFFCRAGWKPYREKSPNEIFVPFYQSVNLFPSIVALHYKAVFISVSFQRIEVLEKLKQIFVESKNSFKENKPNNKIALTGSLVLFYVYKPAYRAGCHMSNFYFLFH